ncbi:LOW QUALITY PROTEIN: hypothetical protein NC651_000138 [Populus alba x Populus x berolinensis]|nr:LOW QUALITY PROTEIN: hypothetical protein NC651_000138 [Populus alba x Populus x berolinensis]
MVFLHILFQVIIQGFAILFDNFLELKDSVFLIIAVWDWNGYSTRYENAGNSGPALVLAHSFGANRLTEHLYGIVAMVTVNAGWYTFSEANRCQYSICLVHNMAIKLKLCFCLVLHTWATQLYDSCVDVVKDEAFFLCNSIGVIDPQICEGIILNAALGKLCFNSVATPVSVRNILCLVLFGGMLSIFLSKNDVFFLFYWIARHLISKVCFSWTFLTNGGYFYPCARKDNRLIIFVDEHEGFSTSSCEPLVESLSKLKILSPIFQTVNRKWRAAIYQTTNPSLTSCCWFVKVPVEHCGDAHHFDSMDLKALMAPNSNSLSAPCP